MQHVVDDRLEASAFLRLALGSSKRLSRRKVVRNDLLQDMNHRVLELVRRRSFLQAIQLRHSSTSVSLVPGTRSCSKKVPEKFSRCRRNSTKP